MARRYAEDTTVSVAQSQAQVQELLEKNGVERIGVIRNLGQAELWFEFNNRNYLLRMPIPASAKNIEQERKRAWRCLLLLIKAKFEAINSNISTIEHEFFANTVMPDGQCLIDSAAVQIDKALTGRTILQLPYKGD